MDREKELLELLGEKSTAFKELAKEVVFIEGQLTELKKLPFIRVNPKNPLQQKATAASKLYKEFLQQYNNSLKTLFKAVGEDETEEESPLRKWANKFLKAEK